MSVRHSIFDIRHSAFKSPFCGVRLLLLAIPFFVPALTAQESRPRAREAGLVFGTLQPGPLNAITDVPGVLVGQVTLVSGDTVNTGVTAVLPHGGDLLRERVPAAVSVGNGFGKLTGVAQIRELGEIETPIVLTCTLCVPRAADGLLDWVLAQPGNEEVRSVNVVVGETNDGFLNTAIRSRPIESRHVAEAIRGATAGVVAEGAVGAGRGTIAFGWKGGIGTSSRRLAERQGGYSVGVLVQSNFGGQLTVAGVRLWEPARVGRESGAVEDGSIMIVIATDAPLDSRQLERLASRAFLGVGRTGSWMSNGSGDFAIAFSTAGAVRRGPPAGGGRTRPAELLTNEAMSPLFQAVAEATEEAIVNSLFRAIAVRGARGTVRALPLDSVLPILRTRGVLQ